MAGIGVRGCGCLDATSTTYHCSQLSTTKLAQAVHRSALGMPGPGFGQDAGYGLEGSIVRHPVEPDAVHFIEGLAASIKYSSHSKSM